MTRMVIKIAGESGMGIESSGSIVMKALKKLGYYLVSDREYPSLIKGGQANVQINASATPIFGMSSVIDIAVAIDREGIKNSLETLKEGGILIHGMEQVHKAIKDFDAQVEQKNIKVVYLNARDIAIAQGGSILMVNVILLGALWKVLGFDISILHEYVAEQFSKKPQLLEVNSRCLEAGYNSDITEHITAPSVIDQTTAHYMIIDGNTSLALGAVQAGMNAYFAYPMSPSSSILSYLATISTQTGVIVKQAEDEITAVQMTLGAMHTGARAMTATSGGGFDLMTETLSLSGMIETPLVIVIAQRPGPATGLPTCTSQGDVNLAIYSGHGDFPRIVLACSDPASAFIIAQKAFHYAEKYQCPVIILTDKHVAETKITTPVFSDTLEINRFLSVPTASTDRFKITENGISNRWLPGTSEITYFANGDEHKEDGTLDETEETARMMQKRMQKVHTILEDLEQPILYGPSTADYSFVGFGSSKGAMLDAMNALKEQNISVNYLHFEALYPLKTEFLQQFAAANSNIHLIEGNHTGQFGNLLEQKAKINFKGKLLKYNGRPFTVEDIINYITHS